ncbi:hypothetical protein FPOAC2_07411 [Fusarium poae]
MQSVCLYNKHWAAVIIRDLFKIDDWQGQVDSIKKAEASLRDDMEQHNSEELKSRLRRIDNTLGHVRLGVKAVESAIQDQTQMLRQIHRDENDQKCLQDLRIVDPEAHKEDIEKTKGGLFEDSYRWILDQTIFGNFELIPRGDCYGSKATRGRGRRCFYAYDSQGRKVFEDGHAFESLKRIFLDMLKDPCLRETVFVVDALDEYSDDSRKDLIDFILEASRDYSSKWVVSSRNWPLIEVQFRGSEDVRVPLELNKDSISQAVRMFIEDKVKQLAQQKRYTPELKDDVRNELLSKANDTFLWVALVCKELARPEVKPRNTITKLKPIPGGLDELYQRMLEQVFRSEDGDIQGGAGPASVVSYFSFNGSTPKRTKRGACHVHSQSRNRPRQVSDITESSYFGVWASKIRSIIDLQLLPFHKSQLELSSSFLPVMHGVQIHLGSLIPI